MAYFAGTSGTGYKSAATSKPATQTVRTTTAAKPSTVTRSPSFAGTTGTGYKSAVSSPAARAASNPTSYDGAASRFANTAKPSGGFSQSVFGGASRNGLDMSRSRPVGGGTFNLATNRNSPLATRESSAPYNPGLSQYRGLRNLVAGSRPDLSSVVAGDPRPNYGESWGADEIASLRIPEPSFGTDYGAQLAAAALRRGEAGKLFADRVPQGASPNRPSTGVATRVANAPSTWSPTGMMKPDLPSLPPPVPTYSETAAAPTSNPQGDSRFAGMTTANLARALKVSRGFDRQTNPMFSPGYQNPPRAFPGAPQPAAPQVAARNPTVLPPGMGNFFRTRAQLGMPVRPSAIQVASRFNAPAPETQMAEQGSPSPANTRAPVVPSAGPDGSLYGDAPVDPTIGTTVQSAIEKRLSPLRRAGEWLDTKLGAHPLYGGPMTGANERLPWETTGAEKQDERKKRLKKIADALTGKPGSQPSTPVPPWFLWNQWPVGPRPTNV